MNTNKALVLAGIKGVFIDRDPTVLDRLFSDDYQQHNPQILNGTAAIKALLETFRLTSGMSQVSLWRRATMSAFTAAMSDGDLNRWWLWMSSASPMARSPSIGMSCRKRCRRRKALTATAC